MLWVFYWTSVINLGFILVTDAVREVCNRYIFYFLKLWHLRRNNKNFNLQ